MGKAMIYLQATASPHYMDLILHTQREEISNSEAHAISMKPKRFMGNNLREQSSVAIGLQVHV